MIFDCWNAKVKGYTGDAELGDALKGADVVVIPGLNNFSMLNFPKKIILIFVVFQNKQSWCAT